MEQFKEIDGNIIKLALSGIFDVVGHGVNSFCKQRAGLAPQMVAAFYTDLFTLEGDQHVGDINKLGQIQYQDYLIKDGKAVQTNDRSKITLTVVNCYTQYRWGRELKPFDYDAFTLCMRKMNYAFQGKNIGLPVIGAGLGGADSVRVKEIMKKEFTHCYLTIVNYQPAHH